jgi:hypothetical protein
LKRRAARDEQLEVATARNQFREWNCGMTELLIMTACDLPAACGRAKVLRSVAQPNAQYLGHLLALDLTQGL